MQIVIVSTLNFILCCLSVCFEMLSDYMYVNVLICAMVIYIVVVMIDMMCVVNSQYIYTCLSLFMSVLKKDLLKQICTRVNIQSKSFFRISHCCLLSYQIDFIIHGFLCTECSNIYKHFEKKLSFPSHLRDCCIIISVVY